MLKRTFDIAGSLALIALFLPLFAVLWMLIAVFDGSPVLFRQTRSGLNGEPFQIFKFRTMKPSDKTSNLVTASGDARITALGKMLRHSKLDELPQLFNVLKGDMSLVGPRPEVPEFVAEWPEADRQLILSVRPGLTDPATLQFLNEEEMLAGYADPGKAYVDEVLPRKIDLYRRYVATASFSGDLRLLYQTGLCVLRRIAGSGSR